MKLFMILTLLVMGSTAWAANTKNIAGYTGQTTGAAYAFNNLGQKRKLSPQAPVFEGETLITGKGASSSVIFKDGTTVELKPSTQFRVEEFKYSEQPNKDSSAVFRMLKGGFRFISGLVNKKGGRLAFKTPTATMGVRGSAGGFSMNENGEVTVEVYEGTFDIVTSSGATSSLSAGQTAATSAQGVRKTESLTKAQLQTKLNTLKQTQKKMAESSPVASSSPAVIDNAAESEIEAQIEKAEQLLESLSTVNVGGSDTSTKTASPALQE